MHSIIDFFKNLHDSGHLDHLVRTGGIPLISLIVFAETGLLVGFFLPGDTMLFLAGVAAATAGVTGTTYLNIWALTASLIVAAIAGDQCGYFFGLQNGTGHFQARRGLLLQEKTRRARARFFLKYGVWAVIFARFIPVLRTFVPFMAGVGGMPYWKYLAVDSCGGFAWITIAVWSGYLLGQTAQHYLHIILPCIAIISMLPVIIGVAKEILSSRKNAA